LSGANQFSLSRTHVNYYRDRASEYDEWFFRQGRYDRGEAHRQQWFAEIEEVESALFATKPAGNILELACGTGLWTQHLAPLATHITAVDAAPEVIALNQNRVNSESVEYIVADLFNWTPDRQFDFIFFGFWLSHVPLFMESQATTNTIARYSNQRVTSISNPLTTSSNR
jgi:ubiquinone/menaquinone biosynthesis C-methylase UbiE